MAYHNHFDGALAVIKLERRPTLAELVEEGASLVAGGGMVSRGVRLYPIAAAVALAQLLRRSKLHSQTLR